MEGCGRHSTDFLFRGSLYLIKLHVSYTKVRNISKNSVHVDCIDSKKEFYLFLQLEQLRCRYLTGHHSTRRRTLCCLWTNAKVAPGPTARQLCRALPTSSRPRSRAQSASAELDSNAEQQSASAERVHRVLGCGLDSNWTPNGLQFDSNWTIVQLDCPLSSI